MATLSTHPTPSLASPSTSESLTTRMTPSLSAATSLFPTTSQMPSTILTPTSQMPSTILTPTSQMPSTILSSHPTPSLVNPSTSESISMTPTPQMLSTILTPLSPESPIVIRPTSGFSGMVMSTTAASGIFGAGTQFDPLIIFALVVAGLLLLLLLGALIYCCCVYSCGVPNRQQMKTIHRTGSCRSCHQEEPVFLGQPVRSCAIRDGTYGRCGGLTTKRVCGSTHIMEPDAYVTRLPVENNHVLVHTTIRKKYLYPTDLAGFGNDITYNTIRPRSIPAITTLGDGYALGHSLRSTGTCYGRRSFHVYDDDGPTTRLPNSQVITIY